MTDETDVSAVGNGQDAEAIIKPAKPVRARAKKAATKATKPAKNKPARAAAKPAGKAKAKPARGAKARKARVYDPAKLDQFGLRKGSIKSRAAAMYATRRGATLSEVRDAVGSTQFNVIGELEGKGFKITRDQVAGIGARQATRYHLLAK